jgi:hypothetical protein
MRSIRIHIHGLALAVANISSLIIGFSLYQYVLTRTPVFFQLIILVAICIALFLGWTWIIRHFKNKHLSLQSTDELLYVHLVAFVWIPIAFIPLHYLSRGHVVSFDHITGLWLLQLLLNALVLFITGKVFHLPHKEPNEHAMHRLS